MNSILSISVRITKTLAMPMKKIVFHWRGHTLCNSERIRSAQQPHKPSSFGSIVGLKRRGVMHCQFKGYPSPRLQMITVRKEWPLINIYMRIILCLPTAHLLQRFTNSYICPRELRISWGRQKLCFPPTRSNYQKIWISTHIFRCYIAASENMWVDR